MPTEVIETTVLWPWVVYSLAVILLVVTIMVLSYLLGERHQEKATGEPYESGVMVTDSARQRISAKFYLVAVFFVIFDLEAVFIYTWSIAIRELGWTGYIEISIFIVVLMVALIYLWRLGGLDWGGAQRSAPPSGRKKERSS